MSSESSSSSSSSSDDANDVLAELSRTLGKYALRRKLKHKKKKVKYTPSRPTNPSRSSNSPRERSNSSNKERHRVNARLRSERKVKERSTSTVRPTGAPSPSPQNTSPRRPPTPFSKPARSSTSPDRNKNQTPPRHHHQKTSPPIPRRYDAAPSRHPDDRARAQEIKQTLHNWTKHARTIISESHTGQKIYEINNAGLPRPFIGQCCAFYNATVCENDSKGCNRRGTVFRHACYICSELLRVNSDHPAKECPLK